MRLHLATQSPGNGKAKHWSRWSPRGTMVDKKWLLGPGPLEPMSLGMNSKPWYKDKLTCKCLAKQKNRVQKCPTFLDSRQWIFVKEGMDDFRWGCPPCEDLFTRRTKEDFLPLTAHRVHQPAPRMSKKKLRKGGDLCSMLSPAQLAQKAFRQDIESHLTKHPLALYPSLEKDLPADLLLKVLEVLDPDRKLEDTWAYCQGTRLRMKSPTKLFENHPARVQLEPSKNTPVSHQDNVLHEERKASRKDSVKSPPPHTKVPRRIHEFCKWAASFADVDILEKFIMKQLDMSYQHKPTHEHASINKLTRVSSDLMHSLGVNKMEKTKLSLQEHNGERKLRKPHDPYKRNWVKIRYGAWYLKPKLWKKLINDEPLINPKASFEDQYQYEKDILEDLKGTIAFKDFILSKGYKMPDLLAKLFIRKGWRYDSVKTPVHGAIKIIEEKPQEDD
ncbi:hypothetical protein MC885_000391 [Smutsia gigantea]|nr:hypothetical protein MC885_000391 [Smutsia gigantea]